MSALDDVVLAVREGITQDNYEGWKKVEDARFELAQLRADLQAAQERIAEQARQLDAARVLISIINQRVYLKRDLQIKVNHWLAANPAPQEQTA